MPKALKRLSKQIKKNQYLWFIGVTTLDVIFLFFNIQYWHSWLAGTFGLIIYFIINSIWVAEILSKFIGLEKSIRFLFGLFGLIYLLTFLGAIFVVFYKITPNFVLAILLLVNLLLAFLRHKFISRSTVKLKINFLDLEPGDIKIKPWVWTIFFISFVLCLYFLLQARVDRFILSPWESIHPLYLYFFAIFTFITGLIVFSKNKIKLILLIIVLHSLLLHAYLPIVYQGRFGGDKWRHIATERYLQEGRVLSPALFGERELSYKKIGPLEIPAVFVVGNKTSYSGQWALTAIFSWLSQIDVFYIDIILGYLLWSIFIPVFLFKLAQFLSRKKLFSPLLAFLPSVFYLFHFYGAITIPIAFGFLFFLFALIFWLNFLVSKKIGSFVLALIFTLMMYLNYILYLVLLLEIGIIIFILFRIVPKKKLNFKNIFEFLSLKHKKKEYKWKILLALIGVAFVILIPILDLLSGLTVIKNGINFKPGINSFWLFIKRLIGFSTYSSSLFSGLVARGNFIYAQMENILSPNTFFSLMFWPVVISVIIWSFIIYGVGKAKKSLNQSAIYLIIIFLIILLLNHFVGQYLMLGSRLFCKRLDLTIAFLMMILLGWGILNFINQPMEKIKKEAMIYGICVFLAIASASTYASGPKMQTVTKSEFRATKQVWQEIQQKPAQKKYCVLANTWPLLALEAESKREIIAGGFPVYREYAQPERALLFNKMSTNPSQRYIEKSMDITQSKDCYFMTEERWWPQDKKKQTLLQLKDLFGGYEKVGNVYIFYYQTVSTSRGKQN